jgi:hypothetical protein
MPRTRRLVAPDIAVVPPGGLLPVGTVATPAGAVTVGQAAGRRLAAMINGPSLPSRSASTNGMPIYAFARY